MAACQFREQSVLKRGHNCRINDCSVRLVLGIAIVLSLSLSAMSLPAMAQTVVLGKASLGALEALGKREHPTDTLKIMVPLDTSSSAIHDAKSRIVSVDIFDKSHQMFVDGNRVADFERYRMWNFQGPIVYRGKRGRIALTLSYNDLGNRELRGFFSLGKDIHELSLGTTGFGTRSLRRTTRTGLVVAKLDPRAVQSLLARCGTVTHLHDPNAGKLKLSSARKPTAALQVAVFATEADPLFISQAGSILQANNDITAMVNGVNAIYGPELSLRLKIGFQSFLTTDPYTSTNSSTLLGQVFARWQAQFRGPQTYAVAHLFSGRNFDGSTVGVAYLSQVCKTASYGVDQRLTDGQGNFLLGLNISLLAHELGHNFGSDHDVCTNGEKFVMCPSLQNGTLAFSPTSRSEISTYVASISCLQAETAQRAPVLTNPGARSVREGEVLQLAVTATDPDGDPVTLAIEPAVSGASLTGTVLLYAPEFNVVTGSEATGIISMTLVARDPGNRADSKTFAITVTNANPTTTPPPSAPPGEPTQTVSAPIGQTVSIPFVPEADRDTAAISFDSALPRGAYYSRSTGTVLWNPALGQESTTVQIRIARPNGSVEVVSRIINVEAGGDSGALPAKWTIDDFNGDGRSDSVVWNTRTGVWKARSPLAGGVSAKRELGTLGTQGDIPLTGDFNGDGISDLAVYRPSTGQWIIRPSRLGVTDTIEFTARGGVPSPGDFDGDGFTDIAFYRPELESFTAEYSSTRSEQSIELAQLRSVPVPGDFNGDGSDDFALYNSVSGSVTVRSSVNGSIETRVVGTSGSWPAVGAVNASSSQFITYDPKSREVTIEGGFPTPIGLKGDFPIARDFDGDGTFDIATFSLSTGQWTTGIPLSEIFLLGGGDEVPPALELIRFASRLADAPAADARTGGRGRLFLAERVRRGYKVADALVRGRPALYNVKKTDWLLNGDINGDGVNEPILFRAGQWIVLGGRLRGTRYRLGARGDRPVLLDADGDGVEDLATWSPARGEVRVRRSRDGVMLIMAAAGTGEVLCVGDYDGDGIDDFLFYRKQDGRWTTLNSRTALWYDLKRAHPAGRIPRVGDIDGDGKVDLVTIDATGTSWLVTSNTGVETTFVFGSRGDTPVILRDAAGVEKVASVSLRSLVLRSRSATGEVTTERLQAKRKVPYQLVGVKPNNALR